MKKTNKGFSMVELIIVIAIMAILAGALAPALIKYINKSRISTDIQTGNTIATAIQTALSNENAYDSAEASHARTWNNASDFYSTGDAFTDAVKETIGGTAAPKVKSKKCVGTGSSNYSADFYYYVDPSTNKVGVALAASGNSHLVFPTATECLTDDTTPHAAFGGGTSF